MISISTFTEYTHNKTLRPVEMVLVVRLYIKRNVEDLVNDYSRSLPPLTLGLATFTSSFLLRISVLFNRDKRLGVLHAFARRFKIHS